MSLGNVLVSYRGEVKLSDFGIAKAESRVSKTQIGMVKGNTGFMAPEQARGEPVDPRADVFSTGVVLFCCLSGHALYHTTGESSMNQLLRAAVGPEKTQFERLRTFPPEVHAVLTKAIAKDANARFGSAAEFAAALQPLATGSRDQLARLVRGIVCRGTKGLARGPLPPVVARAVLDCKRFGNHDVVLEHKDQRKAAISSIQISRVMVLGGDTN